MHTEQLSSKTYYSVIMWFVVDVLSTATTVGVVCSIRLTSDNYTTTKPNNQTKPQTITNTHRTEPGEYQTDRQMATKPNTTRLNLRQSQTHIRFTLEHAL